ncbi:sigma-70 family RNA polymerase sigma factor [Nocardiopsis sp. NPDC058631]|uniref:sigma-70 family RNA polymerase sigma factor n=1 Tax=Nocardiopsis sp. NPDC058631 TaxID=3346566 RepID=UPI0036561824
MTRGSETGEPARAAVEALYDAFALPLYRYAWALLGDDPEQVAGAVHDGLVAGVALDSRRADPADRAPWLYALVRSSCQRRGLAHISPYTRLATVPAEVPVARMFARLPASHRELVELNLRHALPTSATARVLGLDSAICGELSRSAIRRAAENLAEAEDAGRPHPDPASGPDRSEPGGTPSEGARTERGGDTGGTGSAAWRTQVHDVSCALALLRPPGPPPGLRDRVLRTCLDPELSGVRDRIAAGMHPLTSEGYPLHRSRVPGEPEEAPEASEPGPEPLPRALAGDRLTTADHPEHEEETTPLPGPCPAPEDEEAPRARFDHRRWSLPAVAGLATVVLAVALWSWASSVGGPSTVIGTAPAESEREHLGPDVETASTDSDAKPEAEPTGPSTEAPTAPSPAGEPREPADEAPSGKPTGAGAPGDGIAPVPPAGGQSPPADDGVPDGADGDGPGDDDAPGGPPDEGESGDGGGGLLNGLLGLLFGGG